MSEKLSKKYNKIDRPKRLTFTLVFDNLMLLILSIIIFVALNELGQNIINRYFTNTSFVSEKKDEVVEDFKSYIKSENVSIYDYDKIDKWAKEYKYFEIYIFKDNVLIYDSAARDSSNTYDYIVEESNIAAYFNSISFSDQGAEIYIDSYLEYKYYTICIVFAGAVSIIFLNVIMFFLVNKRIKYIETLENEIKILEGGDLNYKITMDGNDELTSLAQSIDEMRKAFIERLQNEEDATSANRELITAISHDLRTPLTAVLGYLDIIKYKKYKTEENLNIYINNCREKAYQMKSMTDKLFEYFLVFNTQNELDLENYNGNELLEQIIQEHFFLLSYNNFNFNLIHCNKPFFFDINLVSIRRVFDNIFTNISKYADNSRPVDLSYHIEGNSLYIEIENDIKADLKDVCSTGIGLKTCKKIIEAHKGKFNIYSTDTHFKIVIELPIHNKSN